MKKFGECPDLKMLCGSECFHVHRCVMISASPVWRAMLTGEFKEANESEIRLEDDEASLGLCIELLYAGIAGSGDVLSRIQQKEMAAVTLVAEKYMLEGVLNMTNVLAQLRNQVECAEQRAELAEQRVKPKNGLENFHEVGFCTRCVKPMHYPYHCNGCGGHSRSNIVLNTIRNGKTDHICTQCFQMARMPHHCDRCGGRSNIVEIS